MIDAAVQKELQITECATLEAKEGIAGESDVMLEERQDLGVNYGKTKNMVGSNTKWRYKMLLSGFRNQVQ